MLLIASICVLTHTILGVGTLSTETRNMYAGVIKSGKGIAGLSDHTAFIASNYQLAEALEKINNPVLTSLVKQYGVDKAVYDKAMEMILKMLKEVLDTIDKKVLTDCKPRIEFLDDLIESTSTDLSRVVQKETEGITGFLSSSTDEANLDGFIRQKQNDMSDLKMNCDKEITRLKSNVKEKEITFHAVQAMKKAAFPPKTMYTQLSADGMTLRHMACVSHSDNGVLESVTMADPHHDISLKAVPDKVRKEILLAMRSEQVPGHEGTIDCPTEMTGEGIAILADKIEDLYNKHSDEYDDAREELGEYQLHCLNEQKDLRNDLNSLIRQQQDVIVGKNKWATQRDEFMKEHRRVQGLLTGLEHEKETLESQCTEYVHKMTEDEYCPLLATRNNLVEQQEGKDAVEKIVDCALGDWVEDACSIDCIDGATNADLQRGTIKASGFQKLNRPIEEQPTAHGVQCGALATTVPCNNIPCPRDCVPEDWEENWGECTSTCGPSTKTRTRAIKSHASNGGADCEGLTQTVQCNTQPCGRHCYLGNWNAWTVCSAACSDHGIPGRQVRTRNIIEGFGDGYAKCPDERSNLRTNMQTCNLNKVCDPNVYLQCKNRARVVLFLDISGSMWSVQTEAVKQMLLALTHRFEYGKYTESDGSVVNENPVEMTYYLYNHRVKTIGGKEPQFHQDMEKVRELIGKTPRPGGGTATHKAINKCVDRMRTKIEGVENLCVVVTDGWTARRPLKSAIRKAAMSGIRVVLVEVTGNSGLVKYLEQFVTYPAASNMLTTSLKLRTKYDYKKRRWIRPKENIETAKQYGWTLSYHIAHMLCSDTTAAV